MPTAQLLETVGSVPRWLTWSSVSVEYRENLGSPRAGSCCCLLIFTTSTWRENQGGVASLQMENRAISSLEMNENGRAAGDGVLHLQQRKGS